MNDNNKLSVVSVNSRVIINNTAGQDSPLNGTTKQVDKIWAICSSE